MDESADADLQPYLRQVWADLAEATREHGPGYTGAQAFTDPHEAMAWDSPRLTPEVAVQYIAMTRLIDAEDAAAEGHADQAG